MKPEIKNILNVFRDKGDLASRKKVMYFSFFLILSIIFWLINALSKNYTTTISYSVRYTDLPEGRTIIGDASDQLTFRVSSHGYNILRNKLTAKYYPVNFSLSSFSFQQLSDNESTYYIPTRFLRDYFSLQLSPDIEILEVLPDTIYFHFASLVTKKLPVKPNLKAEPDKQMIMKGIPSSDPDSVLVSGPDYIVDTLTAIYTQFKDLGVISHTVEEKLELQQPEHVNLDHKQVRVVVGIERFTEKTISVPIEVQYLPDSVKLITFPSSVELTCMVGLSSFPIVQPSLFSVVVNFKESVESDGKLTVQLVKQPDFVKSVKFNPKKVEYLIGK